MVLSWNYNGHSPRGPLDLRDRQGRLLLTRIAPAALLVTAARESLQESKQPGKKRHSCPALLRLSNNP